MTQIKENLNNNEAEIYFRTSDSFLKMDLPEEFIKELETLKKEIQANNLLEVIIKASKRFLEFTESIKSSEKFLEFTESIRLEIKEQKENYGQPKTN